jgi:6-phosphogluconolactonase
MTPVTAFVSRDALMAAVAERIADALRAGIAERGAACAALSGGTTPEPAYRLLAAQTLDWSKVTFALVDERFVPPDQEPSNEGLLRRALAPAFAQGARLAPMYADTPTAREAAERADTRYALLHFDIALMGMGPDGHTASWFPGAATLSEALDLESERAVVAVHAPQAYGTPERLSLTRAALARAGHILVLILGDEKRAYLETALSTRAEDAPIASLFALPKRTPEVLWAS